MTTEEREKATKAFNKFKATYFKGKSSFTGEELEKCKEVFWKQYKKSQQ